MATSSTIEARARQVRSGQDRFEPVTISRRPLGPHDVLIDIAWAGICHTDVHHARAELAPAHFPMVPGHEVAGLVADLGSDIADLRVGDHVGIGCIIDSCRECPQCRNGLESYCVEGPVITYNSPDRSGGITLGGFSDRIVADERYVVRLPAHMDLASAAPLMCAGTTMYSPLRHWRAGPGTRVAVIGFGGLGHVGVQMAHAMGASVTVLNRTEEQEDDAHKMGADDFRVVGRAGAFDGLDSSFDLVLSTVPVSLDLDRHLALVAQDGTFVNLGVPNEPLTLDAWSLFKNRRSLAGSSSGGIPDTQAMIDFCAEHSIAAQVEVVEADAIDDAFDRLETGDVRYRFVIDASTFAKR